MIRRADGRHPPWKIPGYAPATSIYELSLPLPQFHNGDKIMIVF